MNTLEWMHSLLPGESFYYGAYIYPFEDSTQHDQIAKSVVGESTIQARKYIPVFPEGTIPSDGPIVVLYDFKQKFLPEESLYLGKLYFEKNQDKVQSRQKDASDILDDIKKKKTVEECISKEKEVHTSQQNSCVESKNDSKNNDDEINISAKVERASVHPKRNDILNRDSLTLKVVSPRITEKNDDITYTEENIDGKLQAVNNKTKYEDVGAKSSGNLRNKITHKDTPYKFKKGRTEKRCSRKKNKVNSLLQKNCMIRGNHNNNSKNENGINLSSKSNGALVPPKRNEVNGEKNREQITCEPSVVTITKQVGTSAVNREINGNSKLIIDRLNCISLMPKVIIARTTEINEEIAYAKENKEAKLQTINNEINYSSSGVFTPIEDITKITKNNEELTEKNEEAAYAKKNIGEKSHTVKHEMKSKVGVGAKSTQNVRNEEKQEDSACTTKKWRNDERCNSKENKVNSLLKKSCMTRENHDIKSKNKYETNMSSKIKGVFVPPRRNKEVKAKEKNRTKITCEPNDVMITKQVNTELDIDAIWKMNGDSKLINDRLNCTSHMPRLIITRLTDINEEIGHAKENKVAKLEAINNEINYSSIGVLTLREDITENNEEMTERNEEIAHAKKDIGGKSQKVKNKMKNEVGVDAKSGQNLGNKENQEDTQHTTKKGSNEERCCNKKNKVNSLLQKSSMTRGHHNSSKIENETNLSSKINRYLVPPRRNEKVKGENNNRNEITCEPSDVTKTKQVNTELDIAVIRKINGDSELINNCLNCTPLMPTVILTRTTENNEEITCANNEINYSSSGVFTLREDITEITINNEEVAHVKKNLGGKSLTVKNKMKYEVGVSANRTQNLGNKEKQEVICNNSSSVSRRLRDLPRHKYSEEIEENAGTIKPQKAKQKRGRPRGTGDSLLDEKKKAKQEGQCPFDTDDVQFRKPKRIRLSKDTKPPHNVDTHTLVTPIVQKKRQQRTYK